MNASQRYVRVLTPNGTIRTTPNATILRNEDETLTVLTLPEAIVLWQYPPHTWHAVELYSGGLLRFIPNSLRVTL